MRDSLPLYAQTEVCKSCDARFFWLRSARYPSVSSINTFSANALATNKLIETLFLLANSRALSCNASGSTRLIVRMSYPLLSVAILLEKQTDCLESYVSGNTHDVSPSKRDLNDTDKNARRITYGQRTIHASIVNYSHLPLRSIGRRGGFERFSLAARSLCPV